MSTGEEVHELLAEQFAAAAAAGEFDDQLDDFMANEVVPVWQGNAPVADSQESSTRIPGTYRDSIGVTQTAQRGRGQVGTTDEAASYIEYGTEDTPEFAPLLRTINHFNQGQ